MARGFKKRHSGKGTPPGTLISRKSERETPGSLMVFSYNETQCESWQGTSLKTLADRISDKDGIHWIIVHHTHDADTLRILGELFKINTLVLEDILNNDHPIKVEDWDDYSFFVLKTMSGREDGEEISVGQVNLIVMDRVLLTFLENGDDFLNPVIERLTGGKGRMRRSGTAYLAYSIIDSIVDHYYPVLEMFSDRIDMMEAKVFEHPSAGTINSVFKTKRELLVMRNGIRSMTDVFNTLLHPDSGIFPRDLDLYLRDVSDHVNHILQTLDTFREMLSQLVESAMSGMSNKMNEVMKTLTVIATIFIPLTFIVGIYGMNFDRMPELRWRWGYPAVMVAMSGIVIGMIAWFKRKKWF